MKVAILGYGTVGSGVFEIMRSNQDGISRRAGEEVEVKYVLDLRDFPGDPVEDVLVHDFKQIVDDPEVGVVVEVMGGVEKAYSFVKEALLTGKSVCTSNKELVAKHGAELLEIAKQKKKNFLFEASVGGGIPIIRPLNQSLTADEIREVTGVLNGTTNYMLTKMRDEDAEFDDVLADAQAKGYAERNPSADVEGGWTAECMRWLRRTWLERSIRSMRWMTCSMPSWFAGIFSGILCFTARARENFLLRAPWFRMLWMPSSIGKRML